MVAQHFEYRPPRGAGRLAVVGHAGLAACEQRPAYVGRGRVFGAQAAQLIHCGVTVDHGYRVGNEAAFADFEFRSEGGWQCIGGQGKDSTKA